MGIGLRFGVGPLRVYVPLSGGRKRRRRSTSRSRTSAHHGAVPKPSFHGTVPLPDGSVYRCQHAHRTEQAAIECAQKYIRTNFPQDYSSPASRRAAPMPRDNATTEVGKPSKWWPRAGWGTVRGYRFAGQGNGRGDLIFYFAPDDGSQPQLIELTDTVPLKEIDEYARGIMQGDNFTIKVSAKSMAEVAQTFQQINQMDLSKRKKLFADRSDIDGDAGWTWTPDYTLVPVAPGLLN
jgi:hypothetical protein